MLLIYILSIYLSGCIVAYILYRRSFKKEIGEWTRGSRAMMLLMSIPSWLSVIGIICRAIEEYYIENDTPAKW